jgi:hypothetical protein
MEQTQTGLPAHLNDPSVGCPAHLMLPDPKPPSWLCGAHPFFRWPAACRGTNTGVPAVAPGNGAFV